MIEQGELNIYAARLFFRRMGYLVKHVPWGAAIVEKKFRESVVCQLRQLAKQKEAKREA